MKYLFEEEQLTQTAAAAAAPAATACTGDLAALAVDIVAGNPEGQEAVAVIDAAKIKANYDSFCKDFPMVKTIIDYEHCGAATGTDLVAFLRDLGADLFSVKNKVEIEKAIESGICPDEMAFLNPCKPASQIKYALVQGLKVIGCSSRAEVDKLVKAKRQSGVDDVIKVMVMIDVARPQPLDALRDVCKAAQDHGHLVVGISLYGCYAERSTEAFTKALAAARLLFEEMGGEGMKVIDLGELTDEEEDVKAAIKAAAQQQFSTARGAQLMAHAGAKIMKDAVGTLVPIQAVKHDDVIDKSFLVVKESIYGAFNGILAGDSEPENPVLIRRKSDRHPKKASNKVCDILGCSGDDMDVVKAGAEIEEEAEVGDWLLFPNLFSGSTMHMAFPPSSSSSSTLWMGDMHDWSDMAELENLYSLPDLTEESLEFMFNI